MKQEFTYSSMFILAIFWPCAIFAAISIESVKVSETSGEIEMLLDGVDNNGAADGVLSLDVSDCELTDLQSNEKPFVKECRVVLKDLFNRYRYPAGRDETTQIKFNSSLKKLALELPAYNGTLIHWIDPSGKSTDHVLRIPQKSLASTIPHGRLRKLSSLATPGAGLNFSGILLDQNTESILIGNSMTFGQKNESLISAISLQSKKEIWNLPMSVDSITHCGLSMSPFSNTLVAMGQGPKMNNLILLNPTDGSIIRKLPVPADHEITSIYWPNAQTILSHGTKYAGSSSGDIIVHTGYDKGTLTWHNAETGALIRSMDSPLFEATVIDQASAENIVVLGGFQGAALIDLISGKAINVTLVSDILGQEYTDCHQFGCGENRLGFAAVDLIASRRLGFFATLGGQIYGVNLENKKIVYQFSITTPDGDPLRFKHFKASESSGELHVFAAEKLDQESKGYVLVYNIYNGKLLRWHETQSVYGGVSGTRTALFNRSFSRLLSTDYGIKGVDIRMINKAALSIYDMEEGQ
jgi:hypothetical protein